MRSYRISSGRWDIATKIVKRFKALGDSKAKERFERDFVRNKNYNWDHLMLERVTKNGKATIIATRVLK